MQDKLKNKWVEIKKLNQFTIIILIALVLFTLIGIVFLSQYLALKDHFDFSDSDKKDKFEIAKLWAEVWQIRSETSGSSFWIKLIGFLITIITAVGGYLLGQSETTKQKIAAEDERNQKNLNFEHRRDVDTAYQAIIQELSNDKSILRAAAAVKLGSILQAFPAEWNVGDERKKQLVHLTKQILSAALAIEKDEKVLKTITIALVLDKSIQHKVEGKNVDYADVKAVDLSGAQARDAYWAKSDFSYADFFKADLSKTSFRLSKLKSAQFKDANLINAVFIGADCNNANFEGANCENANFQGAKIYGMKLSGANLLNVNTDVLVDVSEDGSVGPDVKFSDWLAKNNFIK